MRTSFINKFFTQKNPAEVRATYHIPERIRLAVEVTPDGWFLVTSPDLPGLVTQGRDAKELLEMVNDAVLTYYDVPRREAASIFNRIAIDGYGMITNGKPEPQLATR